MLKKLLIVYFVFFSFYLLYGSENIEPVTYEWKEVSGKEIVLFVNSKNKSKKTNGSKKAPFKTIEAAFTYLNGLKKKNIKTTLYIMGKFKAKNVYVITMPTRIIGLEDNVNDSNAKLISSYISFEKNAGFVVASSKLFIEKCIISRREFVDEPRSVPIFYSSNSLIAMKNITLNAKEGGTIFRFIESNANMNEMIINSNQNGYCNIIETIKSNIKIQDVQLNCKGRFVVAVDSSDSSLNIDSLNCNIQAHLFALALKVSGGESNIQNSYFSTEGKYTEADEVIMYNRTTKLNVKDITIKGFLEETKLKEN